MKLHGAAWRSSAASDCQVKIERLSGERLEFQLPATAKISDLLLRLEEKNPAF